MEAKALICIRCQNKPVIFYPLKSAYKESYTSSNILCIGCRSHFDEGDYRCYRCLLERASIWKWVGKNETLTVRFYCDNCDFSY